MLNGFHRNKNGEHSVKHLHFTRIASSAYYCRVDRHGKVDCVSSPASHMFNHPTLTCGTDRKSWRIYSGNCSSWRRVTTPTLCASTAAFAPKTPSGSVLYVEWTNADESICTCPCGCLTCIVLQSVVLERYVDVLLFGSVTLAVLVQAASKPRSTYCSFFALWQWNDSLKWRASPQLDTLLSRMDRFSQFLSTCSLPWNSVSDLSAMSWIYSVRDCLKRRLPALRGIHCGCVTMCKDGARGRNREIERQTERERERQ